MKVLYIGYFHDGTGWAEGAIRNALALDRADVDIVCRTVKLNQKNCPPPARIHELEQRPIGSPDVVIQHLLPTMLTANHAVPRNIAVCYLETSGLPHSTWQHHLSLMDEVWVSCRHNKYVLGEAIVGNALNVEHRPLFPPEIKVFPIPTDSEKYLRSWGTLERLTHLKRQKAFIFYAIQTFSKRKNYPALLAAWHSEFESWEQVELVLKVPQGGQELQQLNERIKRELKLPKTYKDPVIISGHLEDSDMMSLHETCDCFVTTSHGEAWSLPTIDALGMGSTPIAPNHTAFTDYLDNENAYLVGCRESMPIGALDTFDELYTADERWYQIDLLDLRRVMRTAFESSVEERQRKAEKGLETALGYDFLTIGTSKKEHLENGSKKARCPESYEQCECENG